MLDNVGKYIKEIIRLYPVIRLRDARFYTFQIQKRLFQGKRYVTYLMLVKELTAAVNNPERLSDEDLCDGVDAMQQLLSHYFSLGKAPILFVQIIQWLKIEPRKRGWK